MRIFSKPRRHSVPEECRGMEVKIESSTCTGEKTIGFFDPISRKLLYRELVCSEQDVTDFYEKYGLKR